MEASTTAGPLSQSIEIPSWKHIAGFVAALFVAILFIGAGAYKAVDPYRWSRMLEELLFPSQFSLPFTLLLAVGEMFGGSRGIGFMVAYGGQTFATDTLFVGVLIVALAGILLTSAAERLERRFSRWKPER